MKVSYLWSLVFIPLLILSACQSLEPTATVTTTGGPSIATARAESYNGPKARIAVNKFSNKAAKASGQVGTGMADMLTTALFHSNRFIVLDRQDMGSVVAEQDLAATGRIKEGTGAPIGQLEGAELLMTGAITAFEPDASGVQGGVLGGFGALVGASKKNAYIAIDVKVVDTTTGRIVAANSIEGKASDFSAGLIGGGGELLGGLGVYKNTPMEKAIRVCINEAVRYVSTQTPANFYRH